jgi:hypothetical protein
MAVMTVFVHDPWSLWGTERRDPSVLGIPLGAHALRGSQTLPSQWAALELTSHRAFRTRTRIPAVDTVESRTIAPPWRSRSAAAPRLPMLPHLRWVCVRNGVKDRNPLRDEGNRWGKPSSSVRRRPWGASAAKIGAIFPCSALRLLLKSACRRRPRSSSVQCPGSG